MKRRSPPKRLYATWYNDEETCYWRADSDPADIIDDNDIRVEIGVYSLVKVVKMTKTEVVEEIK